jgi:hypothetical protein
MLEAEEEKMDLQNAIRAQLPGRAAAEKLLDQWAAKLRAAKLELLDETAFGQLQSIRTGRTSAQISRERRLPGSP